jgi:hypothetical protein
VLTNEIGEYAARAPGPGVYRLTAKRIGVQRFASDEIVLDVGETQRLDIALEASLYVLPEVRVATTGVCVLRQDQRSRVASLWDEARTALTAAQISLRDRLFQAHMSRYIRQLDPKSLRVLEESRAELRGVMDRPFTSLSGDSLSKVGFWYAVDENYSVYHLPDADVLLSAAFQRDHCFSTVDGSRDRRGFVGLRFEPVANRQLGDIEGTLWLDARTFELRFVEFRYTRLAEFQGSELIGGELHFARLPSGAWIVRRWFVRMPQFGRYLAEPVGIGGRVPTVVLRPTAAMYRIHEEGGDVYAEGVRLFERPAVVTGTLFDSSGVGRAGSTVRLGGTPFSTRTGTGGRFRLDSLPPGRFTLLAEDSSYAVLGLTMGDVVVELEEGVERDVRLRAWDTRHLVEQLCNGKGPQRQRATVRLTLLDASTGAPLAGLPVLVRWPRIANRRPGAGGPLDGIESRTDTKGTVAVCDLPRDRTLELAIPRPIGQPLHVTEFSLADAEVSALTVRTRRPR